MKRGITFGNNVLIKLDKDNDSLKFKNGVEIYLDTSFDPEKHATVIGEVYGIPRKLKYTGKANNGMPWHVPMEIQIGDKVVVYYLAVVNCFRPESFKAVIEDSGKYVFVNYQNIYAIIRNGTIMPINGYCLIEPCENPEWTRLKQRMKAAGLTFVQMNDKSNKDVVYGIVRYISRPVMEYVGGKTDDDGVAINTGDMVVMRRISDIPIEYDLHAKLDGGKKYWRVQRRNILAVYEKPV
jgi:hypothetical protein